MSPKDDASVKRKEQILDAAASLFANSGYYKTTTADVARTVGVTLLHTAIPWHPLLCS
jgi:AcrR family transcriptional regulator